MGKIKKKRNKPSTSNSCPTGLPSVKDILLEQELDGESSQPTVTQNLIEKLESPDADERECGANAIARISEKPETIAEFLSSKIAKIAGPLMIDPNVQVRNAITGALRNISVAGGHQACTELIAQDIMTPLVTLLSQYDSDWVPVKKASARIDSKAETLIQAINLLWNLCENSNIAVEKVRRHNLLLLLCRFLNVDIFGIEISIAAAQCIHTVTEDNNDIIEVLQKPETDCTYQKIMAITDSAPQFVLLRTLGAGIFLNISQNQLSNCSPAETSSVMDILSLSLSVEINSALESLAANIRNIKKAKGNRSEALPNIKKNVNSIEDEAQSLNYLLTSKQIALEILTNICCTDDNNEWENVSSSDTSEEMVDMQMDCEDQETAADFQCINSVSSLLHEAILSHNFVAKVFQHVPCHKESLTVELKTHEDGRLILKKLHTIQNRALLCLNNLIQALDIEELGGINQLHQLWLEMAQLTFKRADQEESEFLEASTSALRAILQKLAEKKANNLFTNVTLEELQVIFNLGENSKDESIRVNVVRITATLGCMFAASNSSDEMKMLLKPIGIFLLDTVSRENELWVIAEALDSLFDVFAEDDLHIIEKEICLVEKLNNILPLLKGKINQQKKCLGRHYPLVMTAKENLVRFIKYKSKSCTNGNH